MNDIRRCSHLLSPSHDPSTAKLPFDIHTHCHLSLSLGGEKFREKKKRRVPKSHSKFDLCKRDPAVTRKSRPLIGSRCLTRPLTFLNIRLLEFQMVQRDIGPLPIACSPTTTTADVYTFSIVSISGQGEGLAWNIRGQVGPAVSTSSSCFMNSCVPPYIIHRAPWIIESFGDSSPLPLLYTHLPIVWRDIC